MSGPELTFSVHPRPASDDPKASVVDPSKAVQLDPSSAIAPVEEVTRHKDTLLGDLVFLVRFAFGRY